MASRIPLMMIGLIGLWTLNARADEAVNGWPAHGSHMMGFGGWIMGPLMMLIFFALLVGAVVLIVRIIGGGSAGVRERQPDRSLEILRERFARGEIDAEEFDTRRKTLGE